MRCHCGRASVGWPDRDGVDRLCQDCWEAQCSEEWWETGRALAEAGLIDDGEET